jgi:hypothetical protein
MGDGKPEVAYEFYWEDEHGNQLPAPCGFCGKKACVRHQDLLYCSRCWEFKPGPYGSKEY